jgi:hypothetical protein
MKLVINNEDVVIPDNLLPTGRLITADATLNLTTGIAIEQDLQFVSNLTDTINNQLSNRLRRNSIEASLPVISTANGFDGGRNIPFNLGEQHWIRFPNGFTILMGWATAQQITFITAFSQPPYVAYAGHRNGTNDAFAQNTIRPDAATITRFGFSWVFQPSIAGSQRRQWLAIGIT